MAGEQITVCLENPVAKELVCPVPKIHAVRAGVFIRVGVAKRGDQAD